MHSGQCPHCGMLRAAAAALLVLATCWLAALSCWSQLAGSAKSQSSCRRMPATVLHEQTGQRSLLGMDGSAVEALQSPALRACRAASRPCRR